MHDPTVESRRGFFSVRQSPRYLSKGRFSGSRRSVTTIFRGFAIKTVGAVLLSTKAHSAPRFPILSLLLGKKSAENACPPYSPCVTVIRVTSFSPPPPPRNAIKCPKVDL